MAAVPHTRCSILLLHDPRQDPGVLVWHGKTGEVAAAPGAFALEMDEEGWAYLSPEDGSGSAMWVNDMMEKILCESSGKEYVANTATGEVAWLPVSGHEVKPYYMQMEVAGAKQKKVALKAASLTPPRAGAKVYIQLREIQELHCFVCWVF
eukprot:8930096-Lingulodinium_polyedra.AAC.1